MKRARRLRKGNPRRYDFVEEGSISGMVFPTGVAKSHSINFLSQD